MAKRSRTRKPSQKMTLKELKAIAKAAGIPGYSRMRKPELFEALHNMNNTHKEQS